MQGLLDPRPTGTVAGMEHRELTIRVAGDLPNERYASITHTVFSVLDAAGVAEGSLLLVDAAITDAELNESFDRHNAWYLWGDG
jgi:hypothetical protein